MIQVDVRRGISGAEDCGRKQSENMETTSEGDRLLRQSLTSRYSDWAVEALEELSGNFLITDPSISGHPIVFASPGFLEMSGYDREDVLGQNGKIFQGPETERRSVIEIREAIREERTMQITILNYRKNGTPIWILFHLFPLFGRDDGQVVHFVAVQVPILARSSREHWHLDRTDSVVGSCRREVCEEMEMFCHLSIDPVPDSSNGEGKMEGCNEAGDIEKQKAADAAALVLSTLVRLSELTGRRICRDRCNSVGFLPLPSSLTISLGRIKQSFVLRDPHLPGAPIVYASDGFLNLTGYSRHEVLGRDCRFLCGPETQEEPLQKIQESIETSRQCAVRMLNYRKDGTTFWSTLHVSPVRNATGKIAFFVGVQMEETAKTDGQGLSVEMRQLGAVGAVKVAVRSLAFGPGSSKST